MPVRWVSLLVAVVACAALATASGAFAATAVTTGPGTTPRITVDAAGTGYVTWIDAGGSTFRYCRLRATATACAAPFAYTDASGVDGAYALLPPDGRVLLLAVHGPLTPGRPKALWTSGDGGTTFGPAVQIAGFSTAGANIGGDALYLGAGALGLPAETILTIGQLQGVTAPLQASGTGPGTDDSAAQLTPNVAADAALQDGTLLAVLSDFGTLSWSRYVGPGPATTVSLNTLANWSAPAVIGPRFAAELDTRLVSGPRGAYVGYVVETGPTRSAFLIRKFNGAGWDAPQTLTAGASTVDLAEDPSGRLHALYVDTGGLRYRYTTNAANTSWSTPQTVSTGDSYSFARLAVNADGNGWAVWAGNGRVVRAVPLHGLYTGPSTQVDSSGFGATYRLGIPRGCVAPGQGFRVTLSWRRQRRKGNLFVKVRRADFYLGTRRLRVDTTVPFAYTYSVRVTQPRGSTIRLRARAFIKVRHGRSPKKSIFARVRVCS
jgi:predicted lipoprotein with Yx(FWY)xxD motif